MKVDRVITVQPEDIDKKIVGWIEDSTGICSDLELRPAGPVPDYSDDGTRMSMTFTTPTISRWISVFGHGCFANGKRPLTFACDYTGREFRLLST